MKDILNTPHTSINYLLNNLRRQLAYPDQIWGLAFPDQAFLYPTDEEIYDMKVWEAAYPHVRFFERDASVQSEDIDWSRRTLYERAVFVALRTNKYRPRLMYSVSLEGVPDNFFTELQRIYAVHIKQYKQDNALKVAKDNLTEKEILYAHTGNMILNKAESRIWMREVIANRKSLWPLWVTGVFKLLDPDVDPTLSQSYTLVMHAIERKWGGDLFTEYLTGDLIKLEEAEIEEVRFELS